jgi:hypothetical protein
LKRLPIYLLDLIQVRAGGSKVPHDEYLKKSADLLRCEERIIDGYGCAPSAWEQLPNVEQRPQQLSRTLVMPSPPQSEVPQAR